MVVKINKYKQDGITVVGVWVNNEFKEEVDTHSQFSVKDAKEYFRGKYN